MGGLRITTASTLSLLKYVTDKLGYRYLTTAILSQDRLENIFGIPPLTSAFSSNCKLPELLQPSQTDQTGNISAEVISSFLRVEDAPQRSTLQDEVDDSIELGALSEGETFLISKEQAASNGASALTANSDRGGLFYPAPSLHKLVDALENIFTECFSKQKLHTDSIMDILALLQNNTITNVGCEEHQGLLTNRIVKLYLLTRLHFYTKSANKPQKKGENE
ncbi:hypothetical protein HPB47_019723 [Ixodes persulcatus]|uniref:Uncharacterized protein n=1 Tax=Ixodes persulcatus TaxID=34615 RepID=A0AC60QZR1_IXOPE|nr:hypothetical protein HPB47_019723 [Ixodes persulcatus]